MSTSFDGFFHFFLYELNILRSNDDQRSINWRVNSCKSFMVVIENSDIQKSTHLFLFVIYTKNKFSFHKINTDTHIYFEAFEICTSYNILSQNKLTISHWMYVMSFKRLAQKLSSLSLLFPCLFFIHKIGLFSVILWYTFRTIRAEVYKR